MEVIAALVLLLYGVISIYFDNRELLLSSQLEEVDCTIKDARTDVSSGAVYFHYEYVINNIQYGGSGISSFKKNPNIEEMRSYISENNIKTPMKVKGLVLRSNNRLSILKVPSINIRIPPLFVVCISTVFIVLSFMSL